MASTEPSSLSDMITKDLKEGFNNSKVLAECLEVIDHGTETGKACEDVDFPDVFHDVDSSPVQQDDSEEMCAGGADENGRGESVKNSVKTACKHFQKYLQSDLLPKKFKDKLCGATEYKKLPLKELCTGSIGYQVLNYFAKYFETAKYLQNEKKEIMLNTAERNFSAIKTQLLSDCRKEGHNPGNMEGTATIRFGMLHSFTDKCAKRNENVSESHTTSCWEDIMGVVLLCLWSADAFFAEFAFWVASLVHLGKYQSVNKFVP